MSFTVTVVNHAPVADGGGPYVLDEGLDLVLDGSGSLDPDVASGDSIVTYAWDLDNDGQYDDAAGVMPTVPWAALASLGWGLGTYSIGLQVADSFGVTNTDTTTVSTYRNAPLAVLTVDPNRAAPGQEITFDASGSTHGHPARSIVQYEWDFDYDGTFTVDAGGVQVTHVYGQVGVYTAALRVTDDNVPVKTDMAVVAVTIDLANQRRWRTRVVRMCWMRGWTWCWTGAGRSIRMRRMGIRLSRMRGTWTTTGRTMTRQV